MNFLDAVNRLFVANGIIRGDTDPITSFSSLQHGASIGIAKVAIQDELNELVSDSMIPYEKKTTGSITTVAGTRSYALSADFIRFFGEPPLLYCSSDNVEVFEYPGGENALRLSDFQYKTTQSNPFYWYFEAGTTKKISFYPVPQEAKTYTYDYEGDVSVTNSTDTMPFVTESEAQAFCRLASRRFKLLFEGMDPALIAVDPEHMKAKATLFNLLGGKNAPRQWAPVYR